MFKTYSMSALILILILFCHFTACVSRKSGDSAAKKADSPSFELPMPDVDMQIVKTQNKSQSLGLADACHCSKTYVYCQEPSTPGAEAEHKHGLLWCSLTMKATACKILGHRQGDVLVPSKILSGSRPSFTTTDEVITYCMQEHELTHACDSEFLTSCQTESHAFQESWRCIESYLPTICTNNPPSDCDYLRSTVNFYKAGQNWQQCKCNGVNIAACTKMCAANFNVSAESCQNFEKLYSR